MSINRKRGYFLRDTAGTVLRRGSPLLSQFTSDLMDFLPWCCLTLRNGYLFVFISPFRDSDEPPHDRKDREEDRCVDIDHPEDPIGEPEDVVGESR